MKVLTLLKVRKHDIKNAPFAQLWAKDEDECSAYTKQTKFELNSLL